MPGMMDDQQMNSLKGMTGTAFDKMFLTMMIEHHEGAISMANTEKRRGSYAPAKELADSIVTSQTAEIAQMRKMLGTGSPSPTAS
ncbi:copper resistance protein [Streptomyces albireticuli]|uniref:Copper resistance protein n=2 Tax=Streptomyces albireticuli TaxID=1940 RepID=A0A1Z2KXG2_9ACTN|nr:copper resistance protein [Streptomyces albireticuli]